MLADTRSVQGSNEVLHGIDDGRQSAVGHLGRGDQQEPVIHQGGQPNIVQQ